MGKAWWSWPSALLLVALVHGGLDSSLGASADSDPLASEADGVGKHTDELWDKRAWEPMYTWGKRDSAEALGDMDDEDKRGWKDNTMRVWGKRGDGTEADEKRGWKGKSMRVWGKRDMEEDDKRGWKGNSMRVWGKRDDDKRGWKDNTMRVWGKRSGEVPDEEEEEKRGWKGSNMRVWGKRGLEDDTEALDKRKWGQSARLWGKRDDDKRGWKQNTMRVWGKRNGLPEDAIQELEEAEKRGWKGNQMRVWGKRGWKGDSMRVWGKRGWQGSGPRVWGKRDVGSSADEERMLDKRETDDSQLLDSLHSKDELLEKREADPAVNGEHALEKQ